MPVQHASLRQNSSKPDRSAKAALGWADCSPASEWWANWQPVSRSCSLDEKLPARMVAS